MELPHGNLPCNTDSSNERIWHSTTQTSIQPEASDNGSVAGGSEKDVSETASRLEKPQDVERGEDVPSTQRLVTWDGPDDVENPRNWSYRRKWAVTVVASGYAFIAPLSSNMISPALSVISKDLRIHHSVIEFLVISIYVLGFAIGPLYLGPLSELYGRRMILQVSNILFLVFNTACGGCKTVTQMIAFRFISGMGGSASLSAGGGILSDVWSNEERGKAMGIYTLMPLLGQAVGPIVAGFIVRYSHWRWCFYSVSLGDVILQCISIFLLQETYPRLILARKAKALRKQTGDKEICTEWEMQDQTLAKKLRTALKRPIKLIATQPIVQFVAVYMAFLYGVIYLVLSTLPRLWTGPRYNEEVHIGGLNYIAVGVGFLVGSQVGTRLQDRIYKVLKHRNDGIDQPEFRIPLMLAGALLAPLGIFVYAWSAEAAAFWLWPNLGIAILCASMILCWQCMQAYLVGAYTTYAASALGAATILRSLAGFAFPLFATQLYDTLGYGWGNSILGFAACAIGWPAVFVLWRYGQSMRRRSPFAAGGD
ncbi:synaptic vesicle transporter [Lophiostoma macrostomum CBS 122681]|uniref:Synaptic vesicle transporter n=1 Tax=Lophiostoma macrostomum CBS 122681 TaxID=1314788 RepID=A0A6A6SRX9_9PLEO|nr:synaptic vesicle transporter [Lophiostoma macrostomum CBS 122681]